MAGISKLFRLPVRREDRFTALVRPHVQLMYRMAYRWTQNTDEAEDLVQDVLTRLVPKLETLEAVERLSPWLIKVLYRRYVDLYRRRVAVPFESLEELQSDDYYYWQLEAKAKDPDAVEQLELQQSLNRALVTLEPAQRDAVLLHDVEGYTLLEVSDILEISVGTVKSRLFRAHSKLKNSLREEPPAALSRVKG